MLRTVIFSRHSYGLFLLILGTLLIGMVPGQPVSAGQQQTQMLDDSLEDFARGTFQRTALSALDDGAVELARIGKLRAWANVTPGLPPDVELSDESSVALNNRLYVIGGAEKDVGTVNTVYFTEIDPDQGIPTNPDDGSTGEPWKTATALPAVPANEACGANISKLSAAATVAVATDTQGGGYIYVMGGKPDIFECGEDVTSRAVHIGKVNTSTGAITWSQGPSLPPDDGDGLQYAAAAAIKTNSGRIFVYLFGGLERRYVSLIGQSVDTPKKTVYYAEVQSNGDLSAWQTAAPIPLASGDEGLWRGVAVPVTSDDTGSGVAGQAIYLTGGQLADATQTTPAKYNTKVYRAIVNPDGTLSWDETPGYNNETVTLPEARIAFTGAAYGGKLYLIGGDIPTAQQPRQASVLTAIIEDNLTLTNIGESSPQFFVTTDNVLRPSARASHATVIVPATPKADVPAAAYVYAIAGLDPSEATGTLIRGQLGGLTETDDSGESIVNSGWYYSTFHTAVLKDAKVRQLTWSTSLSQAGVDDIEVQYRTTTNFCNSDNPFANAQWKPLDGTPGDDSSFSVNGANTHVFEDRGEVEPTANCIQYRAKLTKGSNSPVLLDVGMEIFSSGSPDLKVSKLEAQFDATGQTLTGLNIEITNQNDADDTIAVVDVNPGAFYVDLCILNPGESIPSQFRENPLNLGQSPPACVKVYAVINSTAMGIGSTYRLSQRWYYANSNQPMTSLQDLKTFFPQAGTYTLVVAVDSTNYVNEGILGGEGNNVKEIQVTIQDVDLTSYLYLPIVNRR